MENTCLNCGNSIDGKYCKECGQITSVERLTFRSVIESYLSSAFSIEGAFLKTILLLLKNPGLLFREYIAGRRKTYYNPISFFVMTTGIYIVVRTLLNYNPLDELDYTEPSKRIEAIYVAMRFFFYNINYFLIILVFSIGLMLKIFFRKPYNFTEYLMVGFFASGFYLMFSIVKMMIITWADLARLNNFQILMLPAVLMYCIISFIKVKSFLRVLKCLAVTIMSIGLYVLLELFISILITQI